MSDCTVTVKSWRDNWPAFASQTVFPDVAATYFLRVAQLSTNRARWGQFADIGIELFICHNMVLEKQSMDAAKRGGDPGTKIGNISSKSVGEVAVSYSQTGIIDKDAGHWGLTTYGLRYLELMELAGMGPIQIGFAPINSGPMGWAGPPVWDLADWG